MKFVMKHTILRMQIYNCAYGTVARIAMNAIKQARENGMKVGLIRPISVWPFPESHFLKQEIM